MRVPVRRHFLPVLLAALVATVSGCNSDTTTPTTPSTGFTTTDTFSGTVTHNGAQSFSFNIAATTQSTVTATLTNLVDPLSIASSPTVGMSLGGWNGTSCDLNQGIFSDAAGTGAVIGLSVGGSGTMCVRVYDPNSIVVNPLNFTVTVVHP